MTNWSNFEFKEYIKADPLMFNLPKGVSISTMCAKCKLGTELNVDFIKSHMNLNYDDILTVKINNDNMRTLIDAKKKKRRTKRKVKVASNPFYNQITVVVRINEGEITNIHEEPKINLKLFKNGSVQISGLKNIEYTNRALNKLIHCLSQIKGKMNPDNTITDIQFVDNISKLSISDFEIYSSGHRNAQGLHYSIDSKRLYESEHGSLGGDEINILEKGVDYGWPEVAYGRAYGWLFASGEKNPDSVPGTDFNSVLKEKHGFIRGTHPNYAKPLISWYPSVAVGALKQVSNTSALKEWRTNLLVATFADNGMHRIEMLNGRVVLDEQIDTGGRVRDFEITESGMLFIAYDESNLIYLKPKKMR